MMVTVPCCCDLPNQRKKSSPCSTEARPNLQRSFVTLQRMGLVKSLTLSPDLDHRVYTENPERLFYSPHAEHTGTFNGKKRINQRDIDKECDPVEVGVHSAFQSLSIPSWIPHMQEIGNTACQLWLVMQSVYPSVVHLCYVLVIVCSVFSGCGRGPASKHGV